MAGILAIATHDYAEKWLFCIESHVRYSARHGHEYRLHSDSVDGLHPKWGKFVFTIAMLRAHDFVMLIDADAEFAPSAPDYTELMRAHADHDMLYATGNSGRLNSGVLMMRGGEGSAAIAILQHCLDHRETPVPQEDFVTAEGENGHLINAIKQPQFAGKVLEVSRLWNCTNCTDYPAAHIRHYTNELGRAWREGRLDHGPAATTPSLLRRLFPVR